MLLFFFPIFHYRFSLFTRQYSMKMDNGSIESKQEKPEKVGQLFQWIIQ
jgi:hypothetical protein